MDDDVGVDVLQDGLDLVAATVMPRLRPMPAASPRSRPAFEGCASIAATISMSGLVRARLHDLGADGADAVVDRPDLSCCKYGSTFQGLSGMPQELTYESFCVNAPFLITVSLGGHYRQRY